MTTTTESPTDALYGRLADRVTDVVSAARRDRWGDPSPCEEWNAADVVDHLIDTQRDFLARHDLDAGQRPDHDDPAAAWRAHVVGVRDLLARPGVADRAFDGYFGPTTIGATLARFYGFDMVVHRWDLAMALGGDATIHDDELDLLDESIASFGDHIRADGVCGPAVDVGGDATRADRALAATGRDPAWTP